MNEYKEHFIRQKTRCSELQKRLEKVKIDLETNEKLLKLLLEAREIVNAVTITTQEKAKSIIEELVTSVLKTVYGDDYSAELKYEIKRNKSEITPVLVKSGNERNLKREVGGGIVDMYSFGMRIILWAMMKDRTDNLFFLDEPFKNLGGKVIEAVEIIRRLSDEFNIQFIISTHDKRLLDAKDKAFEVKKLKKGGSIVVEI